MKIRPTQTSLTCIMSDQFTTSILEKAVAQICKTVGYTKTQVTALNVLNSVVMEYITKLCRGAHRYAELAGRTEPMLNDFDLVFRDLGINLEEVKEYICNVGEIPPPLEVPKYPIKMESHLNFLRPGNNEVIRRPLHIHEYLPPQFPDMEKEPVIPVKETKKTIKEIPTASTSSNSSHKYSHVSHHTSKKGRPLRVIKSILMTRSGFLSSSCEGKLPQVTLPDDESSTNHDVCEIKCSNITSANLLAAKGLYKKRKRTINCSAGEQKPAKLRKCDGKSSVVSSLGSEENSTGDVIRNKVLQNVKTLKSGSQMIDRRLKRLMHLNNLKYTKITNTTKLVQNNISLTGDDSSNNKGLKVPEKGSESNLNISNNENDIRSIENSIN